MLKYKKFFDFFTLKLMKMERLFQRAYMLQIFFMKASSFYWFFFIYALHNQIYLQCNNLLNTNFDSLTFIAFLSSCGFSCGAFSLWWLQNQSSKKSDETLTINKMTPIYREFTPIFLTFIIIAFNLKQLFSPEGLALSLLVFVFFYINNTEYLNPVFYILRWKIFIIETEKSTYILITNDTSIKGREKIDKIKKINEYTFFYSK